MKAWVLHDINDIRFEDIPSPSPAADEVLLRVKACGICGSDVPRVYDTGAHKMPLIIGHEFSGIVERAGSPVHAHWAGKRVTVFPLIACGKCAQCRQKRYEMCADYDYVGSRRNGAFAEYVCVPARCLMEIPDPVSFEEAAMTEPMAVAVHAMRAAGVIGRAPSEQSVVVYGAGTIGLLLAMFLKDAGCENLFVTGNKDFQREKAEEIGISADHFCDTRRTSAKDFVLSHTGGSGGDILFECIGKSETAADCIDLAAPGGTVVFVGNPHSDILFPRDVYWKILRRQLTVRGTWNSSFTGETDDDWHAVKDTLARGVIRPENLITHRLAPAELEKGLHIMRDKTEAYCKVMTVW